MASIITPMGYRRPLTELSVKVFLHSTFPHLYSWTTSCFFLRVPRRTKSVLWQNGQCILVFCSTRTTGIVLVSIAATSALGRPKMGYSFLLDIFILDSILASPLVWSDFLFFYCKISHRYLSWKYFL